VVYERILAPVDFSRRAVLRLRRAKALAEACGSASVDVLHVWKPVQPGLGRNPLSEHNMVQREVVHYLDTLLELVGAPWFNKVAVAGDPAQVIESYSSRYDLIIIGPNRRGLARVGLGTTAKMIVRRSRCSVLVVPPGRMFLPRAPGFKPYQPEDHSLESHSF
jgi:nucleotide-binding universal stress UspA family protein